MRTFYGVQWWLADESDIRVLEGYGSFEQVLAKAKQLERVGKGYHDFTIYAYQAKLVNEPFWHEGHLYPNEYWQKLENNFEETWDITTTKHSPGVGAIAKRGT